MGRITIAIYRPKPGNEKQLMELVKVHLSVLQKENLATDRKPMVMRAEDGCIIEVFEWKSAEAIQNAHANPEVQKLWAEFNAVCNYQIPVTVKEFNNLFSEFEPIDF
jgi:hypothetical protein